MSIWGMIISGSPNGTCEIVFTSKLNFIEIYVHKTNAKIWAGKYLLIRFGIKKITKRVKIAKNKAWKFINERFVKMCFIVLIGLESVSKPKMGFNWRKISKTPTPFKNPDMTGYGMYLTIVGKDVKPMRNWKTAAIIRIVTIAFISFKYKAAKEAITTEHGPVGPEMRRDLVLKIPPLIKQRIIAPKTPALAPSPVATPNANACGNATMLEIMPPNISPFKFFI